MSAKPSAAKEPSVTLLRNGQGRQDYAWAEGTTLADFLRAAGVGLATQVVQIDGKPIEESVVLQPGMIVSVIPRPGGDTASRSWRDVMGAFHANQTFEEMLDTVEAERTAEKERS